MSKKSKAEFFSCLVFFLYSIELLEMKKSSFISIISSLLIILWVYAALSKLLNYEQSQAQMMGQVFPREINKVLVWSVPLTELFTACLLLFRRWRKQGLLASAFLLAAFSIYIVLVLSYSFGRIPCACGGIISKLGWGEHLAFNIAFLLLTLFAIKHYNRKEVKKGYYLSCISAQG